MIIIQNLGNKGKEKSEIIVTVFCFDFGFSTSFWLTRKIFHKRQYGLIKMFSTLTIYMVIIFLCQ